MNTKIQVLPVNSIQNLLVNPLQNSLLQNVQICCKWQLKFDHVHSKNATECDATLHKYRMGPNDLKKKSFTSQFSPELVCRLILEQLAAKIYVARWKSANQITHEHCLHVSEFNVVWHTKCMIHNQLFCIFFYRLNVCRRHSTRYAMHQNRGHQMKCVKTASFWNVCFTAFDGYKVSANQKVVPGLASYPGFLCSCGSLLYMSAM